MPEKILIVGATGYIASKLIPLLLADGHAVRCLARNPEKLGRRSWFPLVETVKADVTKPETLPGVLNGITTAYYLVHNMSAGQNYHQLDMQAATNFSSCASKAGVKRIVYLGGLADPNESDLALHLASRIQTGDCLRQGEVPVIEFRVGVVVGAGSVSFEMIRFIAEQFPLMIGPLWLRHRTQPVSVVNVLQHLQAVVQLDLSETMTVDIGSKHTQSYIDIMTRYAQIRGLKRLPLLLPFIPVELMAFFIDKLSPVEYSYALPLVEGLKNDSLIQFTDHNHLFAAIKMIEYEEAVNLALEETDLSKVERHWLEKGSDEVSCFHSGLAVHFSRAIVAREPSSVMESLHAAVKAGTHQLLMIPLPKIESETNRISLSGKMNNSKVWLEWLVLPHKGGTMLEQTAVIRPEGLAAFLYVYFNYRGIRKHLAKLMSQQQVVR